jgi:hypothetical protein
MCEVIPTSHPRPRTVSRRRILAASALAATALAASALAASALAMLSAPGRAAETWDEGAQTELAGVLVPAARARLLARVRLGGHDTAFLAFAADLPDGERDLFAIAAEGRIMAIDVLNWRGADSGRLFSRLATVPDGRRVRLERTASAPRGRGMRREAWIDYLAWQEDGAMIDAPVRPVLTGTWQAALAAQRAAMLGLLAVKLHGVPPSLVAALPPPNLS